MRKVQNPYLTHKAPPITCSRQQFQILLLFKKRQIRHDIYENRLLTDDSHEISYKISYLELSFFRKLGKMSQNLSSAAVVIGA